MDFVPVSRNRVYPFLLAVPPRLSISAFLHLLSTLSTAPVHFLFFCSDRMTSLAVKALVTMSRKAAVPLLFVSLAAVLVVP